MAGELVDTSRLFARNAAVIDPRWIEGIAGDICKHSYHSPEWDAQNGFVRAIEQVTLYGLVIVHGRRRDYSRIDPVFSRKLFLLHALVLGEFPKPPNAVRENLQLLDEMRKRAERNRRPEMFDTERLTSFFDTAVPKEIVSVGELKKWLYAATPEERGRFRLKRNEWLTNTGSSSSAFPETIRLGNAKISLSYRHNPDDPETDGITATVRKSDATVLKVWRADWLVPGALPEKVNCLLNSLPSALRRVLSPLSDTVAILMPLLKPGDESLVSAIRRIIWEHNAIRIPSDALDETKLPAHLKIRFQIKDDENGKILASSRNLAEALATAGVGDRPLSASAPVRNDTTKHCEWDFGALDESSVQKSAGWELKNYPALQDETDGVTIRLFKDPKTAAAAHEAGVTRLVYLRLTQHARPSFSTKRLPFQAALYFKTLNYDSARLAEDLLLTSIREAAVRVNEPVRTAEAFEALVKASKQAIDAHRANLVALLVNVFTAAGECADLAESANLLPETMDAIETQLAWLVYPGFVRTVPAEQLREYPRFFRALKIRIERAKVNPMSDRTKEERFAPYWEVYYETVVKKASKILSREALSQYRWMLEEFRVSIFAQEIKTAAPVSPKRLEAKLAEAIEV